MLFVFLRLPLVFHEVLHEHEDEDIKEALSRHINVNVLGAIL